MDNKLKELLDKHGINKPNYYITNRNKDKSANSALYQAQQTNTKHKKNPYTKSNYWLDGSFTYEITPKGHLGKCIYVPPKKVGSAKEYLNAPGPKVIKKKK